MVWKGYSAEKVRGVPAAFLETWPPVGVTGVGGAPDVGVVPGLTRSCHESHRLP